MIHNLTHICVIELNIQYLPMWFYLEKRRKCLFIDHQLTHESYNGLNVNNLPIYIYMLHFLLGKPLYWWPDFANHRNDSMHGGLMLQNFIQMQFIWNFCTYLRSIRECEGIHLVLDWSNKTHLLYWDNTRSICYYNR